MWFLLTIDSVDLCSTLAVNWKQLWRNCVQPNVDACRYMPSGEILLYTTRTVFPFQFSHTQNAVNGFVFSGQCSMSMSST
ncbi:Methionine--tRNA ligase [Trichinella spiralis]|uniref:Methionine--tRNA ligase n=1 Tax=Trichinella spiralis TaxID=6334 RepID=A0ABR3KWE9_TRISP